MRWFQPATLDSIPFVCVSTSPPHLKMRRSEEKCIVFERDKTFYSVRHLLDGVRDYLEESERDFRIVDSGLTDYMLRGYRNYDAITAIFCWLVNPLDVRFVMESGVPFLNFSGSKAVSNVGIDIGFKDIGTCGALFLSEELQLENLAVIGRKHVFKSDERVHEFVETAREKGLVPNVCLLDRGKPVCDGPTIEGEMEVARYTSAQIASFLSELKRPFGIFCIDSALAISVMNTAQGLGLDLYREVKIVCPSNHHLDVAFHKETISTIQLNFRELGYRGAEMMMTYLESGRAPAPVRLRPLGMNPCEKSNPHMISDPLVRKVYSLLREDPSISVGLISEQLNVPQTTLYRRFKQATNQTLSKVIDDERFRAATLLMKTSEFRPDAIAGLAGYGNLGQMRRSIYRYTQLSLKEFYDQCRGAGSPRQRSLREERVSLSG